MYHQATNTIELVCTDQPYEVALLIGYKKDCNYCGIDFVAKPIRVRFDHDPISGLSVDIVWNKPILSRFLGDSSNEKIYFAIVGPNQHTRVLDVAILEAVGVIYTTGTFGEFEAEYHCKDLTHGNTKLINRVVAAYRRNFLSGHELSAPLYSFNKLPEFTVTPGARNCDASVIEKLKKEIRSISSETLKEFGDKGFGDINHYICTTEEFKKDIQSLSNEILKGLGGSCMIRNVPVITRCIINDPAVVVFWSDGTKTVGKCMGNDEFDPEIGLAMAISRKYYELIGFPSPRAAFKNQLKNAEDRSAKTKEKRERKLKLLGAPKADE